MNEREIQDSVSAYLREVISLWPKSDNSDNSNVDAYLNNLSPYLSNDFNSINLINGIDAIAEIVGIERMNQRIQVEFIDTNGYSQRADFKINLVGNLKLESLEMQCSVCFGEGVNDGEECIICGGRGWGVS